MISPGRRQGNCIKNILVLELVIVDWQLLHLLLSFLEPAEAKEENKLPFSVVHTNNISLPNDVVKTHESNRIVENKRR